MHRSARRVLLAAALAATGAGVSGCGWGGSGAATNARPAGCQRIVTQTLGQVAMRAYAQLQKGRDVRYVVTRLAGDVALGDAIARGDAAAVAKATAALRGHYTRLEIERGGKAIVALGRGASLAPVRGALRDHTRAVVASFTVAKLRNGDYVQLAAHLADAQAQVSVPGQPAATRVARAPSGTTAVASTYTFTGESFPVGRLTVTLRIPPADRLCGPDPATTRANVLAGVAQRIYGAEAHSAAVTAAVNAIASDRSLVDAVARSDAGATRAAVVALVYGHAHIVRLRVSRGQRVLSDIGGPEILAPSRGTLRDTSGRPIGQFVMSLQDDLGFRLLTRRFTATHTVLRIGDRVIQGAVHGAPTPLPDNGVVTIRGVPYRLVSFQAQAFPTGSLKVTLMVRQAA